MMNIRNGLFGLAIAAIAVALPALSLPAAASPASRAAALGVPAETLGTQKLLSQADHRPSRRYKVRRHPRHYDRRFHGHRYPYPRHGYDYYYGGFFYMSPWWDFPVYTQRYMDDDHVAWCLGRYRSYDPGSNTYLGYDGRRHRCRSPYY